MINIPNEGWYLGEQAQVDPILEAWTDKPKVKTGFWVNVSIFLAAVFCGAAYWKVELSTGWILGPATWRKASEWAGARKCKRMYIDYQYARLNRHYLKYFKNA